MIGRIFSLEEFSVYDGPGIRTTVFLKGCPLRCSWCHNPEGQSLAREILRSPNGCIGCGCCERLAERDGDRLIFTEKSVKSCPRRLLREVCEDIDHISLCERLLKNKAILSRGGGVTFSGGEPTLQSDFLIECLSYLKGKLHTAIQTCGYCSPEVFCKLLSLTDYVLLDIKLVNNDAHKRYTGVSNENILKNLDILAKSGSDFVIRIPLIPTVTDTEQNIEDICRLLSSHGINYAELLPYNKLAGGKYKSLLREYSPDFDPSVECDARAEIFERYGIKTKIL